MNKFLLATGLITLSLSASAQWEYESESTLMGVYRNYRNAASEYNNYREGFFESRTGAKYSGESFQFEAKGLLRSLQSPANKRADDVAYINLDPPRRLFKAYAKHADENSSNQTVLDVGSLWGSYSYESVQLSAGRRAIGIGVLKVIPVWNRLYPVLPTLSGYMLVNNPDMVDLRWSSGSWTLASYHIVSEYYDESISALELIHYGEKLESHFLVSKWWDQPVAGYSGAMDTDLGIFRVESLGVASTGDETKSGFQVGAGWEKAMSEKLSLLGEYYHSTFGTTDEDEYLFQDTTPFRTLLGTDYFYPQVIYKLTDFLTNEMGGLINLHDKSFLFINEARYSFSDNVDIFANVRLPIGGSGQEFGHLDIPVTNQTLEYVRWVSAGIKVTL